MFFDQADGGGARRGRVVGKRGVRGEKKVVQFTEDEKAILSSVTTQQKT